MEKVLCVSGVILTFQKLFKNLSKYSEKLFVPPRCCLKDLLFPGLGDKVSNPETVFSSLAKDRNNRPKSASETGHTEVMKAQPSEGAHSLEMKAGT